MTTKKCHDDCLRCVDETLGCLECIPGYKLVGNKCKQPSMMYLNLMNDQKVVGNIVLKTEDKAKNYDLKSMNQVTLSMTLKIFGFTKAIGNVANACHDLILLTKDGSRKICYKQYDDSINLMEGGTAAFKLTNFSKYFGRFVTLSVSFYSKYNYNTTSQTYQVDPTVPKEWKNYYAFYVNEHPVPPHREFGYESRISNIALHFNRLELSNKSWAYIDNLRIYKGFYTNPFSLVTHNKKRQYLVYDFNFNMRIEDKDRIKKAPAPSNLNQNFCLMDKYIDFSAYTFTANFAYRMKFYCVADFKIRYLNACSGKTYFDMSSNIKKCLACSLSCNEECAFKGVNGCTSNSLNHKIFQKYTNYDRSILLSKTADINNKYYFSNDIESRRVSLNDMSRYKNIRIPGLKSADSQQYTIEFWFYLYQHGIGDISKSNLNMPFNKEEIIWNNQNKIVIENVNNEIMVTCYPLWHNIPKNNPLYVNANKEFEKYKITRPMSELVYKKSKWAHINCSTDLTDEKNMTAEFNGKKIEIKITIDNKSDNPMNYLDRVKNKTLSASSLEIKYGENAKTNFGMLFFEQMRLWGKSSVRENPPSCLIEKATSFPRLLHSINFNKYESLRDVVTQKTYQLTKMVHPDYKGLNILNTKFDMKLLKEANTLKKCLDLIIQPNSGVEDVSTFLGSVYVPKDQIKDTIKSLYVKRVGNYPKIDISSSLQIKEELIEFKYMITSSFVKNNNLNNKGYPVKMEFLIGMKNKNSDEPEEITPSVFTLLKPGSAENEEKAIISEIKTYTLDKNKTSTDKEIVESAKIIENIVQKDNFTLSNYTKHYQQEVKIKTGGKLVPEETVNCTRSYCVNRGNCSFSDPYKHSAVCTCDTGYSGFYCQYTTENLKLVKNFTVSAIDSIQKTLSEPGTVRDPNTGATTIQANDNKEIPTSVIDAVSVHIENGVKTIDNVEDAKKLNNVVELILKNKNEKSTENVVKSKDKILGMISNMFSFSKDQLQKTKRDEKVAKRLNRGNRILQFIENGIRYLQGGNVTQTFEELYKKKVDLVINHENTRGLIETLTSNFAEHFRNKYSKILKNNSTSLQVLKQQNISEFIIDKDNIHFSMMVTPIIDINEFDFVKWFEKRVKAGQSYIDPKKCLANYLNSYVFQSKKRTEDEALNDVVFAMYINYKEPMYTISDSLLKHATTNTHNLVLFDIKGNIFTLEGCLDEILHYLPISPRNPTFIERYNANPKKYELWASDNVTSINYLTSSYMPVYISPNGTIDSSLSIKDQIETYYPTYKFYLSLYDVRNITLYNTKFDFDRMFVDQNKDSVKYIRNSQVVAASRKLGNMAVMSYYDPPKEAQDKYYFLKNDNVIKRSENWTGNWCFITLTILFGLNFIFVIISAIAGCLAPKWLNEKNDLMKFDHLKYDQEFKMAKIDDLIFDPQLNLLRNQIYGYLYNAEPIDGKREPSLSINANSNNGPNAAYENQGIELQNVNVEMKDKKEEGNQNVNSESNLKSNRSKKVFEAPNSNSFIHFAFKRNIYAMLFLNNSPFNPAWKNLTKFFMLIYFLIFFNTCMFIYSGIDFNPEETINYGEITSSVFLAILMGNAAFTLVNLFYSSMINSSKITDVIKSSFDDNKM